MDVRCFFGMIFSILRSDGVVEGGTGVKAKAAEVNTSNSKVKETVK